MDLKTISNLGRFKDMVTILIRYGFKDLMKRFHLPGSHLVMKAQKTDWELSTHQRIRLALEELGPTFIKFGQILSLRIDLLPAELIRELQKLQDEVPPLPFAEIQHLLEENLGAKVEDFFSIFEKEPISAASLAQVHRAVLKEGSPVMAVKVQRPGIKKTIQTDLHILETVADYLHQKFEELKIYDLPGLVRESGETLLRELDFTREGRHMRVVRNNFKDFPSVYIPDVFERFSTEQVLVMEHIQGTLLKHFVPETAEQAEYLAKVGLRTSIKQIYEDGFFHADPHPGNIIIREEDQVLCLIDWGMIGRLTPGDRHDLTDLISAVVDRDSERLLDAVLTISIKDEEMVDQRGLERALLDIIDIYGAYPIEEVNIGHFLMDVTSTVRKFKLRFPPDMIIMTKALITAEGSARQLYPKLNVISEAEPHVRRIAKERFLPNNIWKTLRISFSQLLKFQGQLPKRLGQIIEKIEYGEINIRFQHENLDGFRKTLQNIFNKLASSIIIGAMIIGSSMIITTGVKPYIFGYPALGILGYLISALIGLWLIYDILSSRY